MHPQDFKSILDHLYSAYCNLHDEYHKLNRENKILNEELAKAKALNLSLTQKLHNSVISPVKLLKMGSEWFFDGDPVLETLSITLKLKFPSPILKSKVSKKGQIAFACNRFVFLYSSGKFYIVEDVIREYNPADMKKDLSDFSNLFFDFNNEDLIIYYRSHIVCFRKFAKLWTIPFQNILNIRTDMNLLYVATGDHKIHVIDYEGSEMEPSKTKVDILEVKEHFKDFIVKDGEIVIFSDNSIFSYDRNFTKVENFNIFGLDFDGTLIYYGGDSSTLKVGKVNKTSGTFEPVETLIFKKAIFSIKSFRNLIFVSIDDKAVNVIDIRNKTSMRIVLPENVVDISCNDDIVCFVDNNGGMRVWRCFN